MLAAHPRTLHNKGRPGRGERRAPPPAGPASPSHGGRAGPRRKEALPRPRRPRWPDPRHGPTRPGAPGAGASRLAAAGRAEQGRGGAGGGARSGSRTRAETKASVAGGCPRVRQAGATRPGRPSRPPPLPGLGVLFPESPSQPLQAGPHLPVGGERASDPGPGSKALRRRHQPPPPRAAPRPLLRADLDRTP